MKKTIFKPVCIAMLLGAFVYGLALPFFWGNNPASELGTLSLLCEDRKAWFWLWGILTSGGIFINSQYMYSKFGFRSKAFDILGILGHIRPQILRTSSNLCLDILERAFGRKVASRTLCLRAATIVVVNRLLPACIRLRMEVASHTRVILR